MPVVRMPSETKTKNEVKTYIEYLYPVCLSLEPGAPKEVVGRDVQWALNNLPTNAVGFRFFDAKSQDKSEARMSIGKRINNSGTYYAGKIMTLGQITTKLKNLDPEILAKPGSIRDMIPNMVHNGVKHVVLTRCGTVCAFTEKDTAFASLYCEDAQTIDAQSNKGLIRKGHN